MHILFIKFKFSSRTWKDKYAGVPVGYITSFAGVHFIAFFLVAPGFVILTRTHIALVAKAPII